MYFLPSIYCLYEQKNAGFNLEVIDSIPTEIDGGVCYFSENVHEYVNDKFLLVNDFAYYASIQIDGKTLLLELQNHDEV